LSAMTLPKYFEMLRTSSSGVPPLPFICGLLPRCDARSC
jgi:hypothetical protein